LPQAATSVPCEVDHVIARTHHGRTVAPNPAPGVLVLQQLQGLDIAGLDPRTAKLTRLFHPRRHR